MSQVDIFYLIVLLGLLVTINFTYKKFPKNHDKLFKMLTED